MAKLVIQGWQSNAMATVGWQSQGGGFGAGVLDPTIMDFKNDGIQVAMIVSLFCDKRFPFENEDEHTPNDRRGWWGDDTLFIAGDRIGSWLWRLFKEKMVDEKIFPDTEKYIRDALQWMLDDNVAGKIEIETRKEDNDIGRTRIIVFSPDNIELTNFFFTWNLYAEEIGITI